MKSFAVILGMVALCGVAGCSLPGPDGAPDGIHDPYEVQNRKVHAFNKRLDSGSDGASGGGIGSTYASVVPPFARAGVSNFSENLTEPGSLVNHMMQGDIGGAGINLLRFALNSTLGLGGLINVASDGGIPEADTDFGETLYVWGVPEGAYLELPILGPSTERETTGRIVDLFTNPLSARMSHEQRLGALGARVAEKLDDRARFGDSIDSVLYGSADSYAQARLIYLQNRRFELGDTTSGPVEDDPLALDTEGF